MIFGRFVLYGKNSNGMRKKSKSGKIRLNHRPEKANNKDQSKPDQNIEIESNPFDFGGLPNRDLRKNLGCG